MFLIPTASVDEGEGMVEVCATLSTMVNTQRPFDVTLTTAGSTGKILEE